MCAAGELLVAVLLVAGIAAQAPQPLAADGLPQVAAAHGEVLVSTMRSFASGLTADDRGRLWAMVQETAPNADRSGEGSQQLHLHRSDDGGKSWRRIVAVPGDRAAWGACTGAAGSPLLHVGWCVRRGQARFWSAVYQRFDTEQERWLGTVEVLQEGVGDEDQFFVNDLAIAGGTVVVCVATHRHPQQPPWPSGWSSGLMVRGTGDNDWRGPFPVNTHDYAVWANLQLHDGRVHTTFRSSPSHSIIGYRSLALGSDTFDQPAPVEISVRPDSGRFVSNASSLLVGPFGERTVVYPAGDQANDGKGQVLIAFAEHDTWHTEVLFEDPLLGHGNDAHEHFTLVRGPGNQALALYSKLAEQHRVLYQRVIDGGRPMGAERVLARSDLDGAYARIVGQRNARLESGVLAIVSGSGDGQRLGVRAVLGSRRGATRWR